jgi:hypothetical protein
MIPTKSTASDPGCIPVSSDCVIWQGPNIPCISLCSGDAISEVTYKIADKLCSIQSAFDLTALQLGDLTAFCASVGGAPTVSNKTLLAVLDFIVKKLVCVNGKVDNLRPSAGYTEPSLSLPTCLRYTDPTTQQTVIQLVHSNYTLRLASQFCELKSQVTENTNKISSHETRITTLEQRTLNIPVLSNVTPSCSYPGIPAGTPVAMNTLLDAVEEDLCNLRKAVGTNTQIGAATSPWSSDICLTATHLSSSTALSKPGTMTGAYASYGWKPTVTNLSESIQNLWITVLDLRCVINDLKNCCGSVDCSGFILDYSATTDSTRQTVSLNFFNKTLFPGSGYANCTGSGSTTISITDGNADFGRCKLRWS